MGASAPQGSRGACWAHDAAFYLDWFVCRHVACAHTARLLHAWYLVLQSQKQPLPGPSSTKACMLLLRALPRTPACKLMAFTRSTSIVRSDWRASCYCTPLGRHKAREVIMRNRKMKNASDAVAVQQPGQQSQGKHCHQSQAG